MIEHAIEWIRITINTIEALAWGVGIFRTNYELLYWLVLLIFLECMANAIWCYAIARLLESETCGYGWSCSLSTVFWLSEFCCCTLSLFGSGLAVDDCRAPLSDWVIDFEDWCYWIKSIGKLGFTFRENATNVSTSCYSLILIGVCITWDETIYCYSSPHIRPAYCQSNVVAWLLTPYSPKSSLGASSCKRLDSGQGESQREGEMVSTK